MKNKLSVFFIFSAACVLCFCLEEDEDVLFGLISLICNALQLVEFFATLLSMAYIPYGLPQEQWPTISYFHKRFPANLYETSSDAALFAPSLFDKFVQAHPVFIFGLVVFVGTCWPNFFFFAFAMVLRCQEVIFISFCTFYFFLSLFVFGYPFGCRILTWYFLLFPSGRVNSFADWLSSSLEMFFALEVTFCGKSWYNSALRFRTICNLCIFCLFDIAIFVIGNFCGYSCQFYSKNFLTPRRLLTSVIPAHCTTHKIRRHPHNTRHFRRHVRITRQMRFQIVRFLRTYEMHFSDLVKFLDQNKEHFDMLEQIYLQGAETPMST